MTTDRLLRLPFSRLTPCWTGNAHSKLRYSAEGLQLVSRAKMRSSLPWRSSDEARMIRRYVFQWLTARGRKPSGRAWARQLGISHTWLQKLVRKYMADPAEMWRLQAAKGDPKFTEFTRAEEYSRLMGERGELRGDWNLSRGAKFARLSERY